MYEESKKEVTGNTRLCGMGWGVVKWDGGEEAIGNVGNLGSFWSEILSLSSYIYGGRGRILF